jgi:hypothetical protein
VYVEAYKPTQTPATDKMCMQAQSKTSAEREGYSRYRATVYENGVITVAT